MAEYKIVNAMKTGEFTGQYGKLFKYAVQLEGETDSVEVSQKPETPAPKSGDTLTGTIQDTQYGKRFKKEAPSGGRGGYARDDSAIRAQWAIGQAVQWALGQKGDDPNVIEGFAKELYAMVDRVKGSDAVDKVKEILGGEEAELPPVEAYGENPF